MAAKNVLRGGLLVLAGAATLGVLAAMGSAEAKDDPLDELRSRNLAQFAEGDVDRYVRGYRTEEPDVQCRIVHYAIKSLGQRFDAAAPMYALDKCDCVTFIERVYALALASDHDSYWALVSRLRHKDGQEGYLNRNHFTIGEWVPNNAWLFCDITKDLGRDEIKPWIPLHHIVRRRAFFAQQGYEVDVPDEKVVDAFIPREAILGILDQLEDGDLVLTIRGELGNRYCQHFGIIVIDESDPEASLAEQVKIAQASPPWSRAIPLTTFFAERDWVQGFKFLRLRVDAETRAEIELAKALE